MKNRLKTIFFVATIAMMSFMASAQTSPVDKVAELDDVYSYYIPQFMIKGITSMGDVDILKASPLPTGLLKKVTGIQYVMTSKKKAVKKAQKILKDLDNPRNYSVLFRSSKNKEEKIVIYASPANSDTFSEAILVVNEHDRQLIVLQLLGEFSMEDINEFEEEFRDDTPDPEAAPKNGKTTVTILDDKDAI